MDASEFTSVLEMTDMIERSALSPQEKDFLELRMDGLTMVQISNQLQESAYKLRTSLQKKLYGVLKGEALNEEAFS